MLKQKQRKNKKRGFTLIELVVVIVILGILAAIALPRLGSITGTAENRANQATARTILGAVQMAIAANPSDLSPTADEVNKYLDGVTVKVESAGANTTGWVVVYDNSNNVSVFSDGTEVEVVQAETTTKSN